MTSNISILETLSVGVIIYSQDLYIEYINPVIKKLYKEHSDNVLVHTFLPDVIGIDKTILYDRVYDIIHNSISNTKTYKLKIENVLYYCKDTRSVIRKSANST